MSTINAMNGISVSNATSIIGGARISVDGISLASGGSTYTLQDRRETPAGGPPDYRTPGRFSAYAATVFKCGSEGGSAWYTGTQLGVNLKKSGSPTYNFTIEIWTNNGSNQPGSMIATSTSYSAALLTGSFAFVDIPAAAGALTNGTEYWIVVHADATDGSNFVQWANDSSSPYYFHSMSYNSSDGVTWSSGSNTTLCYRTYSSP